MYTLHMFWNWIYGGVTSHEVLSRRLLRGCPEEQRGALRTYTLDGRVESGSHPPGCSGRGTGRLISLFSSSSQQVKSSGKDCCLHLYTGERPLQHRPMPTSGWHSDSTATGTDLKPLLCVLPPVTAQSYLRPIPVCHKLENPERT